MVIGNGFFNDTEADALSEMRKRSGCDVARVPFQTIGNIIYYVSETGDLYGMQEIQGKRLTRTRKKVKNKGGWTVRMSTAPHRESSLPLQIVTYCAFVLKRWETDVRLEFINGNPYDVRPCNLRPQVTVHPEYAVRMDECKELYRDNFGMICRRVRYVMELDMEDCKDIVQNTFIYLTTTGHNATIRTDDDFVGLWVKMARLRAIQFIRRKSINYDSDFVEMQGSRNKPCEVDLFHLQPGERRSTYLRMYMEGNTPTEIAEECGCNASTVRSSVARSIRFLRKYLENDFKQFSV